jgi:uncharacterized membrane protein YadS
MWVQSPPMTSIPFFLLFYLYKKFNFNKYHCFFFGTRRKRKGKNKQQKNYLKNKIPLFIYIILIFYIKKNSMHTIISDKRSFQKIKFILLVVLVPYKNNHSIKHNFLSSLCKYYNLIVCIVIFLFNLYFINF